MRAFNEIAYHDFQNNLLSEIDAEIQSNGKGYIIGVDEEQYINFLYEKYFLERLHIFDESEVINNPILRKEKSPRNSYGGGEYDIEVYYFTVKYSFSGTSKLFRVRPNPWTMVSYDIEVDSYFQTVSFSFKLYSQSPEEFRRAKSKCYSDAFINLNNLNSCIAVFNKQLTQTVRNCFVKAKTTYLNENNFFAAINVALNPNTKSVFTNTDHPKENYTTTYNIQRATIFF